LGHTLSPKFYNEQGRKLLEGAVSLLHKYKTIVLLARKLRAAACACTGKNIGSIICITCKNYRFDYECSIRVVDCSIRVYRFIPASKVRLYSNFNY